MIGNRVSNSFNGMLIETNNGRGDALHRVCNSNNQIGRMEGNTFHSHGRFGTYMLGNNFPKSVDVSVENNGFLTDPETCDGFLDSGEDNGISTALANHFDYGNAFVGHYNAGDIQYKDHVSIENLNLIYWKESKSFADKCSAFLSGGYYKSGNLALPDQGTLIIEDTKFDGHISLEFNHHCNVGVTGVLCFPQYVLHNIDWKHFPGKWVMFQNENFQGHNANQNHGGILMLSPTSQPTTFFPGDYISLVSNKFSYLLDVGVDNTGNEVCDSASNLSLDHRYDSGILCKVPLRTLKIYTRNLVQPQPPLLIKIWNHNFNSPETSSEPIVEHFIGFHQIGNDGQTNKQVR